MYVKELVTRQENATMTKKETQDELIEVEICMGSSCFSRGSREILVVLQDYLKSKGYEQRVRLKGTLCQSRCQDGPSVRIEQSRYSKVNPGVALDLLKHHIEHFTSMGE